MENEQDQDKLYNLPGKERPLSEDDVRIIVWQQIRNITQATVLKTGYFQSGNFISGVSGWKLSPTGAEIHSLAIGGSTADLWLQLGETILTADASSLSVSSLPASKDLRVVTRILGFSGAANPRVTFNSDSGNNYGSKAVINGVVTVASSAVGYIDLSGSAGTFTEPVQTTMEINNETAAFRKYGRWDFTALNVTGSTAPDEIVDGAFVWNNTAAQISTITLTASANNILAGSRMTVYGKRTMA